MDSNSENRVNNPTLFDNLLKSLESEISNSGTTPQDLHQRESYLSDCESGISSSENEQKVEVLDNGMIKLHEQDKVREIIKNKFVSSFSCYGFTPQVETIYRNGFSGVMNQVKYRCFCLYSKGMDIKRNGNPNVKYAWYGSSKNELNTILSHGFSVSPDTGVYGSGLYLSPIDHPIESMQSAAADENGLRHVLLCRVILGNTEVVRPGSAQCKPISEEFDSGIDNLVSPNKYIIWNANINTHILPEFIVSFRAGCEKDSPTRRVPRSDWMPLATLIKVLTRRLPPDSAKLISNHHNDYSKHKITRDEMIRRVRRIAGDKLLITIIKSYREKIKASLNSS